MSTITLPASAVFEAAIECWCWIEETPWRRVRYALRHQRAGLLVTLGEQGILSGREVTLDAQAVKDIARWLKST